MIDDPTPRDNHRPPSAKLGPMLPCPRCASPLSEVRVTPRQAEAAVTIDVCDRCNGVWLDQDEREGRCPSVSDLPGRRAEVALVGERGAGIAACPRCEARPIQFAVVDVRVDLCDRCGGVWLDGPEAEELMLPPEEQAARPGRSRAGGYRASALQAVRRGVLDCAACRTATAIEHAYVRDDGLVCTPCYVGAYEAQAAERAAPRAFWLVLVVRALDLLTQRPAVPPTSGAPA